MKRTLVLILAIVMILATSGCGKTAPVNETKETTSAAPTSAATSGSAEEGITRGGTITIAKTTKPVSMDPTKSSSMFEDGTILHHIFETLTDVNENDEIVPCLATEWEFSEDGKTLTMKLRQGVKFHDGADFNAEAVKTNIDWFISKECGHANYDKELYSIESCEIVDDYTVRINLSFPDAALLRAFAQMSGMMLSPNTIKNGTQATNPAGTGPFKLEKYVDGDQAVLVRNENYYRMGKDGKPLPYIDKVIVRIITDDTIKTTNLLSGSLDVVDHHDSTNSLIKATEADNLNTYPLPCVNNHFICFNLNNPVLDNVKVRQALSYAVNRQEIVDVVLEGYATIVPFIGRVDQWYYDDYSVYTYDPDKARKLLAEAGYPNGLTLKLSVIAREPDKTIAELVQQQVKESGFNIEVEALERLAWVELIRNQHGGELGTGVLGNPGMDPSRLYESTLQYLEPTKVTQYKEMLPRTRQTMDLAKRKSLLAEYQKVYLDNALHVFLCQRPIYASHNKKIQDFRTFWYGVADFSEVWIKE